MLAVGDFVADFNFKDCITRMFGKGYRFFNMCERTLAQHKNEAIHK